MSPSLGRLKEVPDGKIGELTMAEDDNLPEDVQEILNIPKEDLRATSTRRLLEHLEAIEHYVTGNGTRPFDLDDAYDDSNDLGDTAATIQDVLRKRLRAASKYSVEEAENQITRNKEELEGQQVAIDRLKNHKHADGEVVWRMQ